MPPRDDFLLRDNLMIKKNTFAGKAVTQKIIATLCKNEFHESRHLSSPKICHQ
jgi:hypothetical protein